MDLRESLNKILTEWNEEKKTNLKENNLATFIRKDFVNTIKQIINTNNKYIIEGSPGRGVWASVPWLSILNTNLTQTTQDGIYPVYLFRADGLGVYLSLNQGTTKPQLSLGKNRSEERAKKITHYFLSENSYLNEWGDVKGDLKLNATTPLGTSYELPNIVAKYYPVNNLPNNTSLERDLLELLKIYDELVPLWKKISDYNYFDAITSSNVINNITISTSNKISTSLPKPFILLAGISGTGKTRFVKMQADASSGGTGENYCIVPVRPDWHEPSDLLGYVSRINGTKYIATNFLIFIVKAISAAVKSVDENHIEWESPENILPYWLCLDEMNLAPVEQYFADYLSILETRKWEGNEYSSEPVMKSDILQRLDKSKTEKDANSLSQLFEDLFGDSDWADKEDLCKYFKKKGIPLPPNLIVAGTVNMDETTHGFSRKVIDRAFTIDFQEFFPNNFDNFFEGQKEFKTLTFPLLSTPDKENLADKDSDGKKSINFLNQINKILKNTPFELAYRSLNELLLSVICFAAETEDDIKKEILLQAVWDDFLMQKILPRIEGDSQKLKSARKSESVSTDLTEEEKKEFGSGTILHELYKTLKEKQLKEIWENNSRPDLLCETTEKINCRSKAKLEWMMKRLKNTHFTDFWV